MKKGYSLIELSIALLVIGIMVGGILVGRSMISAAQTTKIISDFQKYREATNEFFDKYKAWPGDYSQADDYWTGTTSGNGDGTLGDPASSAEYEWFWNHLKSADFIQGNYTGAAGSVPRGQLKNSYITHYYDSSNPTWQAFYLSGDSDPEVTTTFIIDGKKASAIDKKIDNNLPESGVVVSNGDCFTGTYELNTADLCNLRFIYKNY